MAASKQKGVLEQQTATSALGYFRSLAMHGYVLLFTSFLQRHLSVCHRQFISVSTSHCQFITLSVCHSASSSLCQFVTVSSSLCQLVTFTSSLHQFIIATVSSSLIQCTQLMHATLVKRPCYLELLS